MKPKPLPCVCGQINEDLIASLTQRYDQITPRLQTAFQRFIVDEYVGGNKAYAEAWWGRPTVKNEFISAMIRKEHPFCNTKCIKHSDLRAMWEAFKRKGIKLNQDCEDEWSGENTFRMFDDWINERKLRKMEGKR